MELKRIARGAVIAAVYASLTILLAPISMGAVQCRVSEALTVLPLFIPEAVPGLFVGCLLANIFAGTVYDVILGSLATLFAALLTYRFRKKCVLALLFPVLFNAIIVGGYIGLFLVNDMAVWLSMLFVGAGEAVAVYGLGQIVIRIWRRIYHEA